MGLIGLIEVLGGEVSQVGALSQDDAGILAQFPGDLSIADIDAVDSRCACLQETVCETSGGDAAIEADAIAHPNSKFLQGFDEFFAAARDEGRFLFDLNLGAGVDFGAGFVDQLVIDHDFSGLN